MMQRPADASVDTGYIIGLLRPDDAFHVAAVRWAEEIPRARWRLITTTLVLAEIGDELRKHWYLVREILSELVSNPSIEVVPVTVELTARAIDFRDKRLDKEWGLTDCISFVVMQERGIRDALAADRHFEQAGFRALLREQPPRRT
jgi:uncharacterized protein